MTGNMKQKSPTPPAPDETRRGWWIAALVGAGGMLLVGLVIGVVAWRWNRTPAVPPGKDAPALNLPFVDPKYVAKPAVQPFNGWVYVVENRKSGRCLSVTDGGRERGAKIIQGPEVKDAGPTEHWRLVQVGDAFLLVNMASGKALQVPGGNRNKGVRLIQWDINDNPPPHQLWDFVPEGQSYRLKVRHSGQSLAVGQGRKIAGAPIIQWEALRTADQLWVLHLVAKSG
jgi:hypothetical protein